MSGNFFKTFYSFISIFVVIILFVCIFCIPAILSNSYTENNPIYTTVIGNAKYVWPTPGYTTITSYFGKRVSPTSGASSYHSGVDIGAPQGSNLIAITDGTITFTGFLGGGGYTITLSNNNMKITYCHVSPNYIVKEGDLIKKGQVLGYVGPKNVYGVPGNQYYDEYGRPTNGATTGPHLHLGVRVNGDYIDPLSLFQ